MKNTTFRKKALLSSVAMLLVAIVALGSATFAWFTANTTVTATGLAATASAADGLKIAKTELNASAAPADEAYAQTVSIALADDALDVWGPVSPVVDNGAVSMFAGSAATFDNYALGDAATSAASNQYYATDLWLKATSATSLTVSAVIDGTAANYARVMLVDTAGNVTYLGQEDTWKKLTSAGTEGSATATCGLTGDLNCASIAAGQQFHVYIYFEGQDEQCIDANAGKTLTVDLTFTKA